jgi:predicted phosphate transport protein (TIGR00153 family)
MELFGQKESETKELIKEHIITVQDTLELFQELMFAYLEDDSSFRDMSYDVHDREHDADELRRKVERKLYEGAFMPLFREDYIVFAELVDKVADRAETCSDMVAQQRPDIPDEFRDDFKDLVHEVVRAFHPMENVVDVLEEGDQEEVRQLVRDIGSSEENVDKLEWDLIKRAWDLEELELAEKIHLRNLINLVASIADRIENISDRVNIMMVKRNL